jgi:hypothetical protein
MVAYQFHGVSATPSGYVWFRNGSGMSKTTGTMNLQTGKFDLTLTSLDGNGPTGTVAGEKNLNTGQATASCPTLNISAPRLELTVSDHGQGQRPDQSPGAYGNTAYGDYDHYGGRAARPGCLPLPPFGRTSTPLGEGGAAHHRSSR